MKQQALKSGARTSAVALLATIALAGCGVKEIPRSGARVHDPGAPAPTPEPNPTTTTPATPADAVPAASGRDASAPPSTPPSMPGAADAAREPPAVDGPPAPAAPPGRPGVTIAGKFYPRDKVVVLLHIGHSNMAGRATTPPELKPYFYDTDPQLWAYAKGGAFSPAKEPLSPDVDTAGTAGPGMALLRQAQAAAHAGDMAFVSIGHGHSGTYGGNCAAFRKGGLLYDIVMAPARELKGKVTFGAIFTMLGQSEHRVDAAQQRQFLECLATVAADMRGDLGEPELPYMVGDYEMGISRPDIAPTSAFAKLIIAQIQMVPGKITRAAVIPTDDLPMQDDHHFNMAGHRGWAERAFKILLDRAWAPWAAR
jgi:hypothetical protein